MKEIIKQVFPLALTALCTVFGTSLLFHGFSNQPQSLFYDIGTIFSNVSQKNFSTTVAEELNSHAPDSVPTLIYSGKILNTNDAFSLPELFLSQTASDTALYLVDVKSAKGTSVLTTLSATDMDSLNEIPSKVIYDPDNQLLYFYQSGIYTLYIRLYANHQPGVLFECQVPVEMR